MLYFNDRTKNSLNYFENELFRKGAQVFATVHLNNWNKI